MQVRLEILLYDNETEEGLVDWLQSRFGVVVRVDEEGLYPPVFVVSGPSENVDRVVDWANATDPETPVFS